MRKEPKTSKSHHRSYKSVNYYFFKVVEAKKNWLFTTVRNTLKSSHFYQLDGEILQQVDSNPYLGLTISEDLQWKTHITNITKKANSSLGFLRRNLKYCSEDCKRLAYIALVRSILEYGAVVWDPYQSRDIIAVEKVQRQAARFIKVPQHTLANFTTYCPSYSRQTSCLF